MIAEAAIFTIYNRPLLTLTWPLLGRLAFLSDGVSKAMANSRPKGPQLWLGHLRVGELQPLSPYVWH